VHIEVQQIVAVEDREDLGEGNVRCREKLGSSCWGGKTQVASVDGSETSGEAVLDRQGPANRNRSETLT
jgi:hypothetical protein